MKISSAEEYGLRCLMSLVRHQGEDPLTIPDIAEAQGLSLAHVSKIMGILREAELVESVRGRSGGYVLPRPAEQISLAEVFNSLGGRLIEADYCDKHSGSNNHGNCMLAGNCSILALWEGLARIMDGFLEKISLADLALRQFEMAKKLQTQIDQQQNIKITQPSYSIGV